MAIESFFWKLSCSVMSRLFILHFKVEDAEFKSYISGEALVLQVIYDPHRSGHFLLLEWTPEERIVVIYDSIVPTLKKVRNTVSPFYSYNSITSCFKLSTNVRSQIEALFGHLYEGKVIPIRIERYIPKQKDDWSCGLRMIGFLTRRALGLSATG